MVPNASMHHKIHKIKELKRLSENDQREYFCGMDYLNIFIIQRLFLNYFKIKPEEIGFKHIINSVQSYNG